MGFLGIYKSVTVPSKTSAALANVSPSVGCGWTVKLISSASAPISIARAPSDIRSPALGPTIPTPIVLLVSLSIFTILNLIFCDPPNWDENGDGVLDNYNDYENNGSITSKVYVDGNDYSELGDMVAAFVSGEQRGVGLAEEVPPFLGEGIAYLMMVYSNQTSGETMSFQYYDLVHWVGFLISFLKLPNFHINLESIIQ